MSGKRCQKCRTNVVVDGERFCPKCRKEVVQDMKDAGYLGPSSFRRQGQDRVGGTCEDRRETSSGEVRGVQENAIRVLEDG